MAYEQSEMDPETLRSYSRQIYGHEIWLDKIEKADGYISIY